MHYGVRAFAMGKEKDEARTQSYADQRADVWCMVRDPPADELPALTLRLVFVLRSGLANMLVASVPSLPEAMTLGESDITAVWSDVMTAVSLPPCRTSPMTCVASVPLSVLASLSGVSPSEFEPNGTAF